MEKFFFVQSKWKIYSILLYLPPFHTVSVELKKKSKNKFIRFWLRVVSTWRVKKRIKEKMRKLSSRRNGKVEWAKSMKFVESKLRDFLGVSSVRKENWSSLKLLEKKFSTSSDPFPTFLYFSFREIFIGARKTEQIISRTEQMRINMENLIKERFSSGKSKMTYLENNRWQIKRNKSEIIQKRINFISFPWRIKLITAKDLLKM